MNDDDKSADATHAREQATVPEKGRARREPAPPPRPAHPVHDETLTELAGRYRPLDPATGRPIDDEDSAELTRGGMGRIICVFDRYTQREVVIKERLGAAAARPAAGPSQRGPLSAADGRFLHEAKITAQLEHPNIVPIYEIGHRQGGQLYYTMKKVRGQTLAERIDACETLAERMELLPHFLNLCNALAYAHSKGVIHRDVKSENVMIGAFGETVVLDWGLAKLRDRPAEPRADGGVQISGSAVVTLDGEAVGTPAYMAPEAAQGQLHLVDERSDVYALGVVLYDILTGHRPFEGEDVDAILAQVVDSYPPPIASRAPRVPKELIEIAETAMSKDRDWRYADAGQMAEQVRRFLSGAFVAPSGAGLRARLDYLWRVKRAHLAWAAGLLLLILLFGAALAGTRASYRADVAKLGALATALDQRLQNEGKAYDSLAARALWQRAATEDGNNEGLVLAASAVARDDRPEYRQRLYQQATARPLVRPDLLLALDGICSFVPELTPQPNSVMCLLQGGSTLKEAQADDGDDDTGSTRVVRVDLERFEIDGTWTLPGPVRQALRIDASELLTVDAQGLLSSINLERPGERTAQAQLSPEVLAIDAAPSTGTVVAVDARGLFTYLTLGALQVLGTMDPGLGQAPSHITVERSQDGARAVAVYGTSLYRLDLVAGQTRRLAQLCLPGQAKRMRVALGAFGTEVLLAYSCGDGALVLGELRAGSMRQRGRIPVDRKDPMARLRFAPGGTGVMASTRSGLALAVSKRGETWTASRDRAFLGRVADLNLMDGVVLASSEQGLLRGWRNLDDAIATRWSKTGGPAEQVLDLSTWGWLLTRSAGVLRLRHITAAKAALRYPSNAVRDAHLSYDGDRALVLLDRDGTCALDLPRLSADLAPAAPWTCPLEGASQLWMLDQSQKPIAAVSDDAGRFSVFNYNTRQVLSAPRTWLPDAQAERAISAVVTDAFHVNVAVLYSSGELYIGGVQGAEPIQPNPDTPFAALTTTTDGRWLVMADRSGRLWSAAFADPRSVTAPCTGTEQGPRDAARPGDKPHLGARAPNEQRAICLRKPRTGSLLALAPLDEHRVFFVGSGELGAYDLRAGEQILAVETTRAQLAVLAGRGEAVFLSRTTGGVREDSIWPLSRWLFGSAEKCLKEVEGLTGLTVEHLQIKPLSR